MNSQHKRENIIWVSLIPQIAILVVAMIWIYLVPKDNVLVYFTFSYKHALIGIFAGLIISLSGFLFYKFCEKTKMFYETVELFENIMGPIFKNLNLFDILTLSIVDGVANVSLKTLKLVSTRLSSGKIFSSFTSVDTIEETKRLGFTATLYLSFIRKFNPSL